MTDKHSELIERFARLFQGRIDAVGNWDGPGSGTALGPLTLDHFERHLTSNNPADWIGTYPHCGTHVTYGCIDIDGKDFNHNWDAMWELARNLRTVLAVKDIEAHIERTRNGYHLWVFPDAQCEPAIMRRALMAACKALSYDPKEVNPKQESLPQGKIGNYVRVPYHGGLRNDWEPEARYFVEADLMVPLRLEEFLCNVTRTSLASLQAVAALWTPPQTETFDGHVPANIEGVLTQVDGLTFTIWRDGPLEGRDRSNTLMKLAYNLREHGTPSNVAFAVVKDADRRWGKFHNRADCDEQIGNIISHAYAH